MATNKTIWAALLAAQSDFKPLRETGKNPHFRSQYATLSDIRAATCDALAKHGLIVTQAPVQTDGNISVVSRIVHVETGETIEDSCPVLGNVQDMQKLGSAITYARRYLLLSQLNLASSELDDDGGAQNGNRPAQKSIAPELPQSEARGDDLPAWASLNATEAEIEFLRAHNSPPALQAWAMDVGACANEYEARNSWKKIVNGHGVQGGSEQMKVAMLLFYRHQLEKMGSPIDEGKVLSTPSGRE